jgi:hypothetical protein
VLATVMGQLKGNTLFDDSLAKATKQAKLHQHAQDVAIEHEPWRRSGQDF